MLAENFHRLFSGLDRAYGRYDVDSDQSGVKQSGTARTIPEKLTTKQWELHLLGMQGLGVVPIRDDAKVLWAAIVAVIKLSITTPNIVPILLSQLTVQRLSNITQEMIHEKNKLIINPETAAKKANTTNSAWTILITIENRAPRVLSKFISQIRLWTSWRAIE